MTEQTADRICRQLEADAVDRAYLNGKEGRSENISKVLRQEANRFEKAAQSATGTDESRLRAIAERLVDLAAMIEQSGDADSEGRKGRFSRPEVRKLLDSTETVQVPISKEEQASLDQLTKEAEQESLEPNQRQFDDQWEWDNSTRETVIEYSSANVSSIQEFADDRRQVQQHSRALRQILNNPYQERREERRALSSGTIDHRQLARAFIQNRIFRQSTPLDRPGLAICLMVDESGSMTEGRRISKWSVARQVVAMFHDAVAECPELELEVYSYSSPKENDYDCLIRYCYGARNRDIASIANFVGRYNYDHRALEVCGDLFQSSTTFENRWLFVISDGMPCGEAYEGASAIRATLQAVAQLRKRRIKLVNIAIEDYASEEIYGDSWVMKFTELSELVVSMKRLLTSLLRSAL